MIKKIVCLLFSLAGFSLTTFAQSKMQELLRDANVFYMDKRGTTTTIKDSVYFVRVIKSDSSEDKMFIVQDFFLNGSRKLVGKSRSPYANISRQGLFIEYYLNGHRKSVKTFDHDTLTDDRTEYFPNGKLYFTSRYDHSNKKWLVTECSDSTGNILAQEGKGVYVDYDDDFKVIKGKGNINGGLKQGEWTGISNDSIKYICTYSNGICVSGTSTTKSGKTVQFTKDLILPAFNGGEHAFGMFLAHNMRYPRVAKENNVQGKVFVNFIIDENGKLTNLRIIRGIGSGCDDEVIKVLKLSPPWQPEVKYGVAVKEYFTIPISFTLQQEER